MTPYIIDEETNSQAEMSQPMRQWYDTEKEADKLKEKIDFKEPEPDIVIEEEEEPPPPRILPPSRVVYKDNKWQIDKSADRNRKSNDDIVEFRMDEQEADEPFSGK